MRPKLTIYVLSADTVRPLSPCGPLCFWTTAKKELFKSWAGLSRICQKRGRSSRRRVEHICFLALLISKQGCAALIIFRHSGCRKVRKEAFAHMDTQVDSPWDSMEDHHAGAVRKKALISVNRLVAPTVRQLNIFTVRY